MESFKIEKCPRSAYYIPDFLTVEEEQLLLKNIYDVPQSSWTQLSRRRLQNWGGLPLPNGMIQEVIPQWLQACINKVVGLNTFCGKIPNHVLINEYKPKEGIMPHLDGPLYFPTIATMNLGSHTVLNFYKEEERDKSTFSLFLEPRSLLILQDEMYFNYLHGIEEKEEDLINESVLNLSKIKPLSMESVIRGTRVSLTIRHVLKISKFKLRFGQYK